MPSPGQTDPFNEGTSQDFERDKNKQSDLASILQDYFRRKNPNSPQSAGGGGLGGIFDKLFGGGDKNVPQDNAGGFNWGSLPWDSIIGSIGGAAGGKAATDVAGQPTTTTGTLTPWDQANPGGVMDAVWAAFNNPDKNAPQNTAYANLDQAVSGGAYQQGTAINANPYAAFNPQQIQTGGAFVGDQGLRDQVTGGESGGKTAGLVGNAPGQKSFIGDDRIGQMFAGERDFATQTLAGDFLGSGSEQAELLSDEIYRRGIQNLDERALPAVHAAGQMAGTGGSHGMLALQKGVTEARALDDIGGQQAAVEFQRSQAALDRQKGVFDTQSGLDASLRNNIAGLEASRMQAITQRYGIQMQGATAADQLAQAGAMGLLQLDQRSDEFARTLGFNSALEYNKAMQREHEFSSLYDQNQTEYDRRDQYNRDDQQQGFNQDDITNLFNMFGASNIFGGMEMGQAGGLSDMLFNWARDFGTQETSTQGPQGNALLNMIFGGAGGWAGGKDSGAN